jgi:hypothetical protein
MMFMKIYNYDENGIYLGETQARQSPLETDVFLIPARATETAPPEEQDGFVRVWNGTLWQQVEDHRGDTVYDEQTGAALTIETIGPIEAGYNTTPPVMPLDKPAILSARRYEREIAGLMVNGAAIRTDRETQALLLGARIKAKEDARYSIMWKAENGFIALIAADIISISDAVHDHVQQCFSAEAVVDLDSCVTKEDVESAFDAAFDGA